MDKTRKLKNGKTIHSLTCKNILRKNHINKFGDMISLFGKYGFEWSVAVTKGEVTAVTTFQNREDAVCFFSLKVKEYK